MSKNGTSMNLKGQYKTELIFELVLPDKINLQKYNKNNVDPPHKQKWKDTKIPIWPLNSLVIISNQKTHDFQHLTQEVRHGDGSARYFNFVTCCQITENVPFSYSELSIYYYRFCTCGHNIGVRYNSIKSTNISTLRKTWYLFHS